MRLLFSFHQTFYIHEVYSLGLLIFNRNCVGFYTGVYMSLYFILFITPFFLDKQPF